MSERRPMPWSERLYRRFALKYHGRYLITGLQARARERSLDYIERYMRDTTICADRWDLLSFALGAAAKDGLALEFGVADGSSLRHLTTITSGRQFHGFDSFEGLPEAWSGTFERAGKFSRQGALPQVPANVTLHKGWFDKTLPEFLRAQTGPVAFLHVDCDIYSSTKTVFDHLAPRLGAGAVIVFDEYFNYPNWERHEFKAFQEFIRDSGFSYRYLGFAQKNGHVAVRLDAKSEAAKTLAVTNLKTIASD